MGGFVQPTQSPFWKNGVGFFKEDYEKIFNAQTEPVADRLFSFLDENHWYRDHLKDNKQIDLLQRRAL